MADLKSFILNPDFNIQMATDPRAAIEGLRENIRSNPELEGQYGAVYDDIFADDDKTKAWASRVRQAYETEGVKQTIATKTTPQQGLPTVPITDPNLRVPQQPATTALEGKLTPDAPMIRPEQIAKNEEEMFKYLTRMGGIEAGIPTKAIDYWTGMTMGMVDPMADEKLAKEQAKFLTDADRVLFDPQVFFPATAYVLFGSWPGLLTIMTGGGIGSLYTDAVNTGKLPNVLPPFDQPALGGKPLKSALVEGETPTSIGGAISNAGEAAATQGIWELFGILAGGTLGGITTKRAGPLGRQANIKNVDDVIDFADRIGVTFPGAYLSGEGQSRMIWDFSHATITSEATYNKWVATLTDAMGDKATKEMFKDFSSSVVGVTGEVLGTRDIGKLIGDVMGGSKIFSDLGENMMWGRIDKLDRFGIRVDASNAVGTINRHIDRILANVAPEDLEGVKATLGRIRGNISEFRSRGEVLGTSIVPDEIVDEFPLKLTFKETDNLRKTFRRYARTTNDGAVQELVYEIVEDLDKAMLDAASRVGPDATEVVTAARKFTDKKHDVLDKEVIKDIMSKHGGKRELWAGISESISKAAKTTHGPDAVKQLNETVDYFLSQRKAWVAGEYDVPENMIDTIVERWKTDYFDDLRNPTLQGEAPVEMTKAVPTKVRLGFKGTDVDDVVRRIRKDMTYNEFADLLTLSKDEIMDTVRASTLNDLMGISEEFGEVAASGGGLYKKMIDKMKSVETDELSRSKVRELMGFDPIRLNAELFHGSEAQKETYRALFTKPQLTSIRDVTHHLAVLTGGGLKYKSNVMVVKLVQAGVLATVAVKTIPLGEDESYDWKDVATAAPILIAPWALTKIMLKPLWARWFQRGFTRGTLSRQNLTNIGRLSMALWQQEGVPLFIGAGMDQLKGSSTAEQLGRGLAGEATINKLAPENK